jgi:hypothetical protein
MPARAFVEASWPATMELITGRRIMVGWRLFGNGSWKSKKENGNTNRNCEQYITSPRQLYQSNPVIVNNEPSNKSSTSIQSTRSAPPMRMTELRSLHYGTDSRGHAF